MEVDHIDSTCSNTDGNDSPVPSITSHVIDEVVKTLIVPYDKNDLYADTCVISMPQLMNAHAICVLQPNTCG